MNKSKNTRDMRSLGGYIYHFKKYGIEVKNPRDASLLTLGIIETRKDDVVFIPLLYNGRVITKNIIKLGFRRKNTKYK